MGDFSERRESRASANRWGFFVYNYLILWIQTAVCIAKPFALHTHKDINL